MRCELRSAIEVELQNQAEQDKLKAEAAVREKVREKQSERLAKENAKGEELKAEAKATAAHARQGGGRGADAARQGARYELAEQA